MADKGPIQDQNIDDSAFVPTRRAGGFKDRVANRILTEAVTEPIKPDAKRLVTDPNEALKEWNVLMKPSGKYDSLPVLPFKDINGKTAYLISYNPNLNHSDLERIIPAKDALPDTYHFQITIDKKMMISHINLRGVPGPDMIHELSTLIAQLPAEKISPSLIIQSFPDSMGGDKFIYIHNPGILVLQDFYTREGIETVLTNLGVKYKSEDINELETSNLDGSTIKSYSTTAEIRFNIINKN